MAHRYRLAPTTGQVPMLTRHCADARFVWNLALEQANWYRPEWGSTPNRGERQKQLAEARKDSWLGEGSSSVQQVALRDFDQAMRNWWAGTHGRPTWRSKQRNNSFCVRDLTIERINRKWATILVPKLGPVRFRLSRPLPTKLTSARISMDRSGRWHVSFVSPQPAVERTPTGESVGIDLGVTRTITLSTGEHIDMPDLLTPGELRRRLKLQRSLARQQKGSKRREVTKVKLAKLSARETDRAKDWVEKVTTDLVRRFDTDVIENLKVTNMTRSAAGTVEEPGKNVAQKRGLNRSILRSRWGLTRTRLEQKAAVSGVTVIAVPAANTSRRCAVCGHTAKENRESQAVFHCIACGHKANADVNAAINILAAGQAVAGRGGDRDERPDEPSTTRAA